MSKIDTIQDSGLARLMWEGVALHLKEEKVACSVESLATAFSDNGTERDFRRAWYRAVRTLKDLVAAQEAVWVADRDGHNNHYRMLTFKERIEVQVTKCKAAGLTLPVGAFVKEKK